MTVNHKAAVEGELVWSHSHRDSIETGDLAHLVHTAYTLMRLVDHVYTEKVVEGLDA